jgi:GNAT superfamily N-acetyltransferase
MSYHLVNRHLNDWLGIFGMDFHAVAELILSRSDNWLKLHGTRIDIEEMDDFGISVYRHDRRNPHIIFDVVFNYEGDVQAARLRDVAIEPPFQGQNFGGHILTRSLTAAIKLGCDRLYVQPASMGSYYWPRHGAIICQWPEYFYFAVKFESILNDPNIFLSDWKEKDINWLRKIYDSKIPRQLNDLAARDDLEVSEDRGKTKLYKFILEDIYLGPCVFDLRDPWTLDRLRSKLAFDAEAAKSGMPERPTARKLAPLNFFFRR